MLTISNEHGFALWAMVGKMIRGWCLGMSGQAAEGIELFLQGLAEGRVIGCDAMMPFYLTTFAEIYGLIGEPEKGLERLTEAAELFETSQERWAEAETHRLRGTLLRSMHDEAAAEDNYHKALGVAQGQSAKLWELRAATSLAGLWRDQDKRTEARDLLAPVYGWFAEGLDTPVLQDAKKLLDELDGGEPVLARRGQAG